MEITTVSSTFHRKWNLGDYESVEAGASMYARIDEGEDPDVAEEILFEQCKQSVYKAVKDELEASHYQRNKAKIKHTVMGQTVDEDYLYG